MGIRSIIYGSGTELYFSMFRITSFTGYSSLNTCKGCTSYVMISPVFMVKYEILYSLYHYEDVPCTHESLERHSSRHDERKKKARNTSV